MVCCVKWCDAMRCRVMWYYVRGCGPVWRCTMQCDVNETFVTWCDVTGCDETWGGPAWSVEMFVMSLFIDLKWCDAMWRNVTWRVGMWCDEVSVMWCDDIYDLNNLTIFLRPTIFPSVPRLLTRVYDKVSKLILKIDISCWPKWLKTQAPVLLSVSKMAATGTSLEASLPSAQAC